MTGFLFPAAALPKPTFTSELADKQVKEGENLSLDVKIPAECKAEVSWYRDDTLLKEDHRITIISAGDLHCLTIFGVAIKDEAVYKVVATNSSGTNHSDCEVLIEGKSHDLYECIQNIWCTNLVIYKFMNL